MSDHETGFLRGKMTPDEGGKRIPLIVNWKEYIKAGQRRDELASTPDLVQMFWN